MRKDYHQADGGLISPEISFGYSYDVIADAIETTSRFVSGGPSFRSEGADPDQSTFNIGLGLGYTSPKGREFTLGYDYENRDSFAAHSALARIALPF